MSVFKCPGSDIVRYPRPENIPCPSCGEEVEIWSDEVEANCPACGKTVSRPMPSSCLQWCRHGRECVGPEKFERLKEWYRKRETAAGKDDSHPKTEVKPGEKCQ